jgi:hypothetical protein
MKTITQNLFLTFVLLLLTVNGFSADRTDSSDANNTGQKFFLELNGTNTYADASQMLGGLGQATLMGWIKLNPNMTADGFIMGQDNLNLKVLVSGNNKTLIATAKNQSIAFPKNLVTNRWYHVAVVYDNSAIEKLTLYVNGKKEAVSTAAVLSGTLASSTAKFTMGKNPNSQTEYLKGGIDEVRVFNVALTQDILQKMVYQEIKQNGTKICGEVIPRDIEGTAWASLLAYFRMDASSDNTIANAASVNNASAAQTFNAIAFRIQQAPMPFETSLDGSLEAAVSQNNSVNGDDAANSWSIIHITNNINLPSNQTTLGILIGPNVTVTLTNNNKLENTWYLKLDGKLDLMGKSQLVQTINSELDPTSSGYIERDQQGQSNMFNYNYWCSPVGAINATANNNAFTIDEVLRDATDSNNLQPITWTTDLNGAPTMPITLSSFWIFKFQNMTPDYANWTAVGQYGNLLPAQGFTLKGSSPTSGTQNLAFVGKPNNGTITSPIAAVNLNLTGNPYPSALDANAFILANSSKINGTLYFWEHSSANNTHILVDYQGGYATRNLVGGTPSFSPSGIVGSSTTSRRIPGRFIPVGQAFFVQASWGGELTFTNSQRAFIKENSASSNMMFRQGVGPEPADIYDNSNDAVEEDTFARIRLGFDAPSNFHRQTLIGFMEENATANMDAGYDAVNIDTQPYDMYLMNGTNKLIIEGEGFFNENNIYPIGIKAAVAGTVSFTLDATENLDEEQDIFIYDNTDQAYHDIRNGNFEVEVSAGTTTNRFSLRFLNPSLMGNRDFNAAGEIGLTFTGADNTIVLENNKPNTNAETIALYNMLGQTVASWDIANQNQTKLQIPILNAHAGTYVVKVHTTSGDISKKIIVQ